MGDEGAEKLIKTLQTHPDECREPEQVQWFLMFVDIAAASLHKQILTHDRAKQAHENMTASDIAWGITNFQCYADPDTKLTDRAPKKTKKGNPSNRQNERTKLAVRDVRVKIETNCFNLTKIWRNWERGLDEKNETERPDLVKQRKEIKKAWAGRLEIERKDEGVQDMEDVSPSNGGMSNASKARAELDLSTLEWTAV